jgi:hypothetical protein
VADGHFLLGQALADDGQVDAAVASLRRAALALAKVPQPGQK